MRHCLVLAIAVALTAAESCCWCGKAYNASASVRDAALSAHAARAAPRRDDDSPKLFVTPALRPYLLGADSDPALLVRTDAYGHDRLAFAATLATTGAVVARGEFVLESESEAHAFALDLKALPLGLSDLQCTLSDAETGEVVAKALADVSVAPRRGSVVRVDYRAGHVLVDGLPFVPYGFFHGFGKEATDAALAEVPNGFNTLAIWWSVDGSVPAEMKTLKGLLDRAAVAGAKVLILIGKTVWMDDSEAKWAAISSVIEVASTHNATLAYFLVDEPDGTNAEACPQVVASASRFVRERDLYHPVVINLNCMSTSPIYAPYADVMMADVYPVAVNNPVGCDGCFGELNDVGQRFEAYQADLLGSRPFWYIPQAFGSSEHWDRAPTARETRVMTYLGVIHGARGVLYWVRQDNDVDGRTPQSPSAWAEARTIAAELAEFVPAMTFGTKLATRQFPETTQAAAWLHSEPSDPSRRWVTIAAVNRMPQLVEATISLPNGILDANVTQALSLLDGRAVPVLVGRVVSDTIEPYGTRIFRVATDSAHQHVVSWTREELMNPSFEVAASVGTPDSFWYLPHDPLAAAFTDGRVAYSGLNSLRVQSGITVNTMLVTRSVPVTVAVRARSTTAGTKFTMCVIGKCRTFATTADDAWGHYVLGHTVPAGTSFQVGLSVDERSNAVWFDSLEVIPN